MPRYSKDHVPSYRLHKQSGQAIVTIGGRDFLLGSHGTPESRQKYNRLIAEWFSSNRNLPALTGPSMLAQTVSAGLTVEEVIARFWAYAQSYYRDRQGAQTDEVRNFKYVLTLLRRLFGGTLASDFGPKCLKLCQNEMVRMRLSRKTINRRSTRIRQVFTWAVSEELVPANVAAGLRTVAGLKKNRSEAKEIPDVKPADEAHVLAALPYASTVIAAMIELQMITGMRSGEMVIMRACDIDQSESPWKYKPSKHKTEHHGHERLIYLGDRAQKIIKPFLKENPVAYLFSPAAADAERLSRNAASRKTPIKWGNRAGTNVKAKRLRAPGALYTSRSYCHAVAQVCKKAFKPPAGLSEPEKRDWQDRHHFHPHQLRHTAATRFRRDADLETARAILGQKTISAAEIYAEVDTGRARSFMQRAG